MAAPTELDRDVTVRVSTGGKPSVRDGLGSEQVVSVLFGTDLETWRQGWNRRAGGMPAREVIVSASEGTRGAGTAMQVVPEQHLAYTVLDTPVDTDLVLDTVSRHLDGVNGQAPSVLIDDLGPLVTDRGITTAIRLVEGLRTQVVGAAERVVIGCSFDSETAPGIVSLFDPSVDVGRLEHPIVDVIDRIRRDDPTTFGYLRRHWEEARDGIETCDRNYPQAKQVHAAIAAPETTPRTLGATLSGLVRLRVLDTWGDTVGSTRYDLTVYDSERMWAVGAAFGSVSNEKDADVTPDG